MKDKKLKIEEEKWIKTMITIYVRTKSTPPKYWMDKIEKKYGVTKDLYDVLCAEVMSGFPNWS